jgi:hypothetical protein
LPSLSLSLSLSLSHCILRPQFTDSLYLAPTQSTVPPLPSPRTRGRRNRSSRKFSC